MSGTTNKETHLEKCDVEIENGNKNEMGIHCQDVVFNYSIRWLYHADFKSNTTLQLNVGIGNEIETCMTGFEIFFKYANSQFLG